MRPQVGTQPHHYETPVRFPSTGAYGRKASPQVAAIPPTRLGHIKMSSVQPGSAIQLSRRPKAKIGTAAVPWPRMVPWPATKAPIRKRLWLLPPIASALVPSQPIVRGCSRPWLASGEPACAPAFVVTMSKTAERPENLRRANLLSGRSADLHVNDVSASVSLKLPFAEVMYAAVRMNGAVRTTPSSIAGDVERVSGLVALAIGASK